MAALTSEQSSYLLALAQGLSGLLAISAAVLVFLAERTVQRARAKDPSFTRISLLTTVFSIVTVAFSVLSWWTWDYVAPSGLSLMFGWSCGLWIGLIFGLVSLVGAAILVVAVIALIKLHSTAASWPA